ncbi:MAG: A/G-specific adenine glycosylase [Dehalococcoidia bacterium]|nr:MAG: A/G-specific adenine glycosylase [Dehalococcoidia bacterium]
MAKPKGREFRPLFEQKRLKPIHILEFQHLVWQYYREHGRSFPWRETTDPYQILVSEIMLQQTQTSRVEKKYYEFLSAFPDFFTLASASLREVLQVWQGLGYNRRALALQQTAQRVATRFDGQLPDNPAVLQQFPGIGQYTAAAVAAIAFNKPTVFVETNIRTVFLHHFFENPEKIADRAILVLVKATLDIRNPREWYYALFDYGAMLKRQRKVIPRFGERRQSHFRGSNREIRGQIVQLLLTHDSVTTRELVKFLNQNSERVRQILVQLQNEGLIETANDLIHIR